MHIYHAKTMLSSKSTAVLHRCFYQEAIFVSIFPGHSLDIYGMTILLCVPTWEHVLMYILRFKKTI